MANRRLLVILIIFVVLGGIAAAGGTIFVVRHVEVHFTNKLEFLAPYQQQLRAKFLTEIAPYANNRNILFGLDRDRITEVIENESEGGDYRVRVTNIEVHFPNRLVIRVRERYPVFQINMGGNERRVFDNQLRFVTTIPINRDIIDIGGQIVAPNLNELKLGQHLDDLFLDQDTYFAREQLLKINRLRSLGELFWTRNNYEDSLNHLFRTIIFHESHGNRLDMELVMRHAPTRVEIENIGGWETMEQVRESLNFRRMLSHIWDIREKMEIDTGLYIVYINASNTLVSRHTRPDFGG